MIISNSYDYVDTKCTFHVFLTNSPAFETHCPLLKVTALTTMTTTF